MRRPHAWSHALILLHGIRGPERIADEQTGALAVLPTLAATLARATSAAAGCGRVTRRLRKKGLLPAEQQLLQAEPDALKQATQTALCLGQLAKVDERGQVVNPPARGPGRRTGRGAHAGSSLHARTVVGAGDRDALSAYCERAGDTLPGIAARGGPTASGRFRRPPCSDRR